MTNLLNALIDNPLDAFIPLHLMRQPYLPYLVLGNGRSDGIHQSTQRCRGLTENILLQLGQLLQVQVLLQMSSPVLNLRLECFKGSAPGFTKVV